MTVFLVHVSSRRKEPSDLYSSGAGSTNMTVGTVPDTTKAWGKNGNGRVKFKTWPCFSFVVWLRLLAPHFHLWRNCYSRSPFQFLCFHHSHWKPDNASGAPGFCFAVFVETGTQLLILLSMAPSVSPSCFVNKWTCHGNVNEGHICHHHTKLTWETTWLFNCGINKNAVAPKSMHNLSQYLENTTKYEQFKPRSVTWSWP